MMYIRCYLYLLYRHACKANQY